MYQVREEALFKIDRPVRRTKRRQKSFGNLRLNEDATELFRQKMAEVQREMMSHGVIDLQSLD